VIISLALDNAAELQRHRGLGEPILYGEKLSGVTYALSMIDARLYLVAAFTSQKKPQDKQLVSFCALMASGMRHQHVLSTLKKR
jgi:hypothetical protein